MADTSPLRRRMIEDMICAASRRPAAWWSPGWRPSQAGFSASHRATVSTKAI
jgi:hypothetical protein